LGQETAHILDISQIVILLVRMCVYDAAFEFPQEKAWQAALPTCKWNVRGPHLKPGYKPACLEDFNVAPL
jgi:hypothetical protein